MKPEEYNPKAREAFAKSLIDIGVTIFKSIILLVTVLPITAIIKSILSGEDNHSLFTVFSSISNGTWLLLITLITLAIGLGYLFREDGLKHLHELEEPSN